MEKEIKSSEEYFDKMNDGIGWNLKGEKPGFIEEKAWMKYYDEGIALVSFMTKVPHTISIHTDDAMSIVIIKKNNTYTAVNKFTDTDELLLFLKTYVAHNDNTIIKLDYTNLYLINKIRRDYKDVFKKLYKYNNSNFDSKSVIGIPYTASIIKNAEANVKYDNIKEIEDLKRAIILHFQDNEISNPVWIAYALNEFN